MDHSPPPQLMLIVLLLLVSTSTGHLSGNSAVTAVVHNLHCVNDYVSTISCSLSLVSPQNTTLNSTSYWLLFKWEDRDNTYVCVMSEANGGYSCSFDINRDVEDDDDKEVFVDTDVFQISLCHALGDTCRLLDEELELPNTIKPNPPCCLTVHNSSRYLFSWESSYEKYNEYYSKDKLLMYQLHFYQRGGRESDEGDKGKKKVISVRADDKNLSVDAGHFEADTEYVATVRSSPNQVHYTGEWSDWSPEVHWRTEQVDTGHVLVSDVDMRVIVPLCVVVPLVLFLCFVPVKKWKSKAFIPTPAPYFQTLYSDYQGDFKRWVVTPEKRADVLTAEESLQIDALSECEEVQEEDRSLQHDYQVMKGSLYSNMSDQSSSLSLLGIPYAVGTTATFLDSVSLLKASQSQSPSLSSGPGSPAGDSGCWLSSSGSFERDAPWYNNEYCTLNAFHKSHTAAAEQHASSFNRTTASRDYQNAGHQEARADI